MRKIAGILKVA